MPSDEPLLEGPGYAETTFALRPPRVAIVFPAAGENWTFFARLSLWEASQLWGGAGFIVVPHHDGVVNPHVLSAVAAYDPDYVVASRPTRRELQKAYPSGSPRLQRPPIDDSDEGQKQAWEKYLDEADTDELTHLARRHVAEACEVYRRRDRDDDEPSPVPDGDEAPRWNQAWRETEESVVNLDSQALTKVDTIDSTIGMRTAAPASLPGPWGAAVGAAVGLVSRPVLAPDIGLNEDDERGLCEWMISHLYRRQSRFNPAPPILLQHHPQGLTLGVDMATLPTAWDRTEIGLIRVGGPSQGRQSVIVIGDTADDFALAVVADRMLGDAIWLHSNWSPDANGTLGRVASMTLQTAGARNSRRHGIVLTSASKSSEELRSYLPWLRSSYAVSPAETRAAVLSGGGETQEAERRPRRTRDFSMGRERETVQVPLAFKRSSLTQLAFVEDYSARVALPVVRDAASVALAASPPLLRPSNPILAKQRQLSWHVDLHLPESRMPTGRGLDPRTLCVSEDDFYETWVRSGNRNLSFESSRYDYVPNNPNTDQRLARPRIRLLTLREWVRSMAAQVGYDIGWSDAGRRAHLMERMWGARSVLIDDFASNFLALTELYNRTGKETKDVYPDGEGVYVRPIGFLNFHGIRTALNPLPQPSPPNDGEAAPDLEGATDTGGENAGDDSTVPILDAVHAGPNATAGVAAGHDASGQDPLTLQEPDQAAKEAERAAEEHALKAAKAVENAATTATRRSLDFYLTHGIIRRGLLLVCGTCEQVNFTPIAELSERNRCRRCGDDTNLTIDTWRLPRDEPTWFYDLHQVARDFRQDNGHAPLLLAKYLSSRARHYADCAELNLLLPGTRRSVAEADLIAHIDGKVVTAEVKTNDLIGTSARERKKAARKRVMWASVLHADEIILGTTQPSWQPSSVSAVAEAISVGIADGAFAPTRTPRLRLITNLGTLHVGDEFA